MANLLLCAVLAAAFFVVSRRSKKLAPASGRRVNHSRVTRTNQTRGI